MDSLQTVIIGDELTTLHSVLTCGVIGCLCAQFTSSDFEFLMSLCSRKQTIPLWIQQKKKGGKPGDRHDTEKEVS